MMHGYRNITKMDEGDNAQHLKNDEPDLYENQCVC